MDVGGEDGVFLDVRESKMGGIGREGGGGESAGERGYAAGFPFDCRG